MTMDVHSVLTASHGLFRYMCCFNVDFIPGLLCRPTCVGRTAKVFKLTIFVTDEVERGHLSSFSDVEGVYRKLAPLNAD